MAKWGPKHPIRGWFIKMREPNDLFWTLGTDNNYTTMADHALLFARKQDAQAYFDTFFHPTVQGNFTIGGLQ